MLRCRNHWSRAALGKTMGLPEALCMIFSSQKLLFWNINFRVTNVNVWRSASAAVAANIRRPHPNRTSSSWEGVISDLDPV